MFNIFSSSSKNKVVAVEFLSTGVAVVEINSSGKKEAKINRQAFLESVGQKAQAEALKSWVAQNNLEKTPCHCVVTVGDYQLFQLERPEVDDAELQEAIKWKIKDLLSYDVEQAVIDFFPMPDSSKNSTKQINVVSANQSVIAAYVEVIKEAELKLVVIDINELVLKNIFDFVDCKESSIAVLMLQDKIGQLYIFKEGNLYVVRDFKLGLNQLQSGDSAEANYDAILLEVQRSVDYFESYYGVGGINKLLITPQLKNVENMANYLQNFVSFDLDFIDVANISEQNKGIDFDHRCFIPFCAGLRKS